MKADDLIGPGHPYRYPQSLYYPSAAPRTMARDFSATASASARSVPVEPPPPPPDQIQLTMSKETAETLYAILNRVGGDPVYSRRAHADSLRKALCDVGIREPHRVPVDPSSRSIYFMEEN